MPDINVYDEISVAEDVQDSGISAIVELVLPNLVLSIYANVGWNAAVTLPKLEMVAYTGATVNITLPALTISAHAIRGLVCNVNITLPKLSMSAGATSPLIATVSIELPNLILSATSIHDILADVAIILPLLQISSLASLSGGVITGYAINLKTMGLSEYADYNFNSACLIGGVPFGANSLGLFRLNADDDSGTFISASVSFPLTDFGIDNKKRVRSVYFGGKADGVMKLYTENDEGNSRERLFKPKEFRSKTKIPIGREGKGSYWKFKVVNVRGYDFKIDTLEMFPIVLERE